MFIAFVGNKLWIIGISQCWTIWVADIEAVHAGFFFVIFSADMDVSVCLSVYMSVYAYMDACMYD